MTRLRFLLLVLAGALLPATSEAQRLPSLATPEHYDLHFAPDLAAERFTGRASIRVSVPKPTNRVVLHAADMQIDRATVEAGGRTVDGAVSLDASSETATIEVPGGIQPGTAVLHLEFTGRLNRELRGFYISEARNRKYAVTQLEATDARRMFPSFDEPSLKATFSLSVEIDADDEAISNGAIVSVTPGSAPGTKRVVFETTATMSTYLVALAIGDFECSAPRFVGATPVRVCATPGNRELMDFPLEAATATLAWMNEYVATDYPFSKLDLVAIPDFAAGAMENTGAVFFREALLLARQDASERVRQRIARIIAHEIAHHWFGNLVTMQWWNDIWLNEGFASWMETRALAAWQPEWNLETAERQGTHQAMAIDALGATRPVRVDASTPAEILALFDPIAYEKAAAVLAMVEAYVGTEPFRAGINAYLETHAYGNAAAEDFWNAMARATRQPADDIFRTFVEQPGLPLVTIDTDCRKDRTVVTLTQAPFVTSLAGGQDARLSWTVPVCFDGPGDGPADRCELLTGATRTLELEGCPQWLLGNRDAEGYYRTRYGADALDRLRRASADLDPDEHLSLLDDLWALVQAGQAPIVSVLDMVTSLAPHLEEPELVESVAGRLEYLHEYVATEKTRPALEAYVRNSLLPALQAATTGNERRRARLLTLAGRVGRDPNVLASARRDVERYLDAPDAAALSSTVLDALVPLAALTGDRALWNRYRDRAEAATIPEERYRFLQSLAQFSDPDLLTATIEYALSGDVRVQDRPALLAAVLANPAGRDDAWRLLQKAWPELQRTLAAFGGIDRIVGALGGFCTRERLEEVRTFLAAHPVAGSERTIRQTLEEIETCARLREAAAPDLAAWLASRGAAAFDSGTPPSGGRSVRRDAVRPAAAPVPARPRSA